MIRPVALATASAALGLLLIREPSLLRQSAALGFAILTAYCAGRSARDSRSGWLKAASALLSLELALVLGAFTWSGRPGSVEILQVAASLAFVAAGMSWLALSILPLHLARRLTLLLSSIAIAAILGEIALRGLDGNDTIAKGPEWHWSRPFDPDPVLGEVNPPYSELRLFYPDNPRGYFDDAGEQRFSLQVLAGNEATLQFPEDTPGIVRIAITKAVPDVNWNVQLNMPRLAVDSSTGYTLTFRARADRPRPVWAGVALAHSSGANLGLYRQVDLSAEWQQYSETFTTTGGDDNARVHFDLANAGAPVEFADVRLLRVDDGRPVQPHQPPRYFVPYRFNGLGCRGHDYAIPRPSGVFRILALGDSFTLGVGVHERDTFAAQLQRRALESSARGASEAPPLEVINCGVSGWATRQERLFYEMQGARYEPQLVLLSMVFNDDMSWLDEVRAGTGRSPAQPPDHLFRSWALFQKYRGEPVRDYSDSIQNLRHLADLTRRHGARLAIVVFQLGWGREWDALNRAVTDGLEGRNVPILNLASALAHHPYDGLIVHAVDPHPNEKAHDIAASEIDRFLRHHGLIATR